MSAHGVTIYQVAEYAGVSISTVSRVLRGSVPVSESTRQRVLAAVTKLKYVPSGAAASLATNRQPTLGMVLPHLSGEYYANLLIGFELAAGELGYNVAVTLANPRSDARAAVRVMAERVEGLAFMARSAAGDDLIGELAGPRAVVTAARGEVPGVPALFTANTAVAIELTGHLLDTGRSRFAFIGTPEPASDLRRRYDGVSQALLEHNTEPAAVIECRLKERAGLAVAEGLLAAGLPYDALVCGNDLLALAIHRTLTLAGVRIPDDVAVTGWDDIHAARYVTPGLTTVGQPVQELGRLAAIELHAQLTGESAPTRTSPRVIASRLVHRESCCTDPSADHSHLTK